ncbi:MAG TPA: sterol desaturase family protein [Rhizomicrobium sp.]|nr:sterol desaturase family protein [Rhizomicrobium sp.]
MEKAEDTAMIAARETAARNPAQPPPRLPRDAASAIKVFANHPSTQFIALATIAAAAARLWAGHFSWIDAAAALGVWAYFPVNEWLIHVFILHFKPVKLFGRTLDFYLPKTHRRHHAEPWNLDWIFIPRHVHALSFPVFALIGVLAYAWGGRSVGGPVLSGIAIYLLLGLHYEWVHYLAHIPWCPNLAYYKRRVREHRWHHFRNENYWWGVSMGLGDRIFGTAPLVEETGRSGTTATIGVTERMP